MRVSAVRTSDTTQLSAKRRRMGDDKENKWKRKYRSKDKTPESFALFPASFRPRYANDDCVALRCVARRTISQQAYQTGRCVSERARRDLRRCAGVSAMSHCLAGRPPPPCSFCMQLYCTLAQKLRLNLCALSRVRMNSHRSRRPHCIARSA